VTRKKKNSLLPLLKGSKINLPSSKPSCIKSISTFVTAKRTNLATIQTCQQIILMKPFASISIVAVFATFTFFSSCKDDTANNDPTAVTDNALVEGESNRVIQAINTCADDSGVNKPAGTEQLEDILPSCAVITIDTTGAKSITIDFGTTPCLCSDWDGKYREGKIIATWTGMYRDSGTVISISTVDYYVGYDSSALNKFEYLKAVTNEGHNDNGNLHFSINVITAIVTLPSGQLIVWNSARDREWIEGESTWLPFDDKYSITGSAQGTDRNGNPFTVDITSPVIVALICPWIEQGTLEITHGNLPAATLDYGTGNCDAQATVTINGTTTTITL
jgi:hypothetical protein